MYKIICTLYCIVLSLTLGQHTCVCERDSAVACGQGVIRRNNQIIKLPYHWLSDRISTVGIASDLPHTYRERTYIFLQYLKRGEKYLHYGIHVVISGNDSYCTVHVHVPVA